MYDVLTIGAATRDVFIRSQSFRVARDKSYTTGWGMSVPLGSKVPVDSILFETGGGATNTAVSFARFGLKVGFIGKLGAHDARGQEILALLKSEGVDTRLVAHDQRHSTGYSVLLVTPSGERTALVYRGASANIQPKDIPWSKIRTRWLYVTSLSGNVPLLQSIFREAARHHIKIAWNPGSAEIALGKKKLWPWLRQAAVININQEEASQITGQSFKNNQAMQHDLCFGVPGIVVITQGRHGASVCDNEQRYVTVPHNIKIHNTTGAGDAFGAGFLAGLIKKPNDIRFALQVATANSESVIQQLGAKAGLLHRIPPANRRCRVLVSAFPNT